MSKRSIFDSVVKPVPPIRFDLHRAKIKHEGNLILHFHDSLGYAQPNFALDAQVEPVLSLINGEFSIQKISSLLNGSVTSDELLEFIQLLDSSRILNSTYYQNYADQTEISFEQKELRPAILAGENYPADSDELNQFLSNVFQKSKSFNSDVRPNALFAPHIDLRVGAEAYAEAFSALSKLKPARVVILATSHYSGLYPATYRDKYFIGSKKNFQLPGRILSCDQNFIKSLNQSGKKTGFTLQDRAHRIEHSIELHLIFASHIWRHPFQIVPILVNSFDELFYKKNGQLAKNIQAFSSILNNLADDETFFLISGDLSHVGRKFGDHKPADSMRTFVEQVDNNVLEAAVSGSAEQLLKFIEKDYDSTRICGFPPLYTFLNTQTTVTGEKINYNWWDESKKESAVSFGSLLYSKSTN